MTITTRPPEGRLLEQLRKSHRPRLSMRKAADRAGLSEGRWRQIENGYQTVTAGQQIAVRAPAETLAHLVHALGGNRDQLADVGREDAAVEFDEIAPIEDRPLPPGVADSPERVAKREHVRYLRALANEIERELGESGS